jgi:hypothetical protein
MASEPSKALPSDYECLRNQLRSPDAIPSILSMLKDNPEMRICLPEDFQQFDYEKLLITAGHPNNVELFERIYEALDKPIFAERSIGDIMHRQAVPSQIRIYIENNIPYRKRMCGVTGPTGPSGPSGY